MLKLYDKGLGVGKFLFFEIVMLAGLICYALGFKFYFRPEIVEAEEVGDGVEFMVGEVVHGVADNEILEFGEAVEGVLIPAHPIVERTAMLIDSDNAVNAGMRIHFIECFYHYGEV